MGDRRVAEIKTSSGSLFFYTHWAGYKLPDVAKDAVNFALPRLGDEPYWVRGVVDQLIKGCEVRDSETGAGLTLDGVTFSPVEGLSLKCEFEDSYNHNKPSVIIDAATGKVTILNTREASK